MHLTVKQKASRISYKQHQILKESSKAAKDLYNKAIYIKRQNLFGRQKFRKAENINYKRLYYITLFSNFLLKGAPSMKWLGAFI